MTVPGFTKGELLEMSVQDALLIAMALNDALLELNMTSEALDELRRAARTVIAHHAEDVLARYAPEPERSASLKVVK
jgi:hypothetical protein